MVAKSPAGVLTFGSFLVLCALVGTCYGVDLKLNFYKYNGDNPCPSAEGTVSRIVKENVIANPSLAAKLLRLHFHDCFVRGCDASILLKSTSSNQAEKDAVPNLSLGGFDVINEIKAKIEESCPGVVSCADIVALAARDAVTALKPNAWWAVKTGRRDGKVSIASEAFTLPSPFDDFETLKNNFESKGLDVVDLVSLSGAHTIGITHCIVISSRLYNFNGIAGASDPSLDSAYVQTLKQMCPQSGGNPFTEVDMDPSSAGSFDSNYFRAVENKKGIFVSDAALLNNVVSRALVNAMGLDEKIFFKVFGKSMQKMGDIGVLTGTDGQIRTTCNVVN